MKVEIKLSLSNKTFEQVEKQIIEFGRLEMKLKKETPNSIIRIEAKEN